MPGSGRNSSCCGAAAPAARRAARRERSPSGLWVECALDRRNQGTALSRNCCGSTCGTRQQKMRRLDTNQNTPGAADRRGSSAQCLAAARQTAVALLAPARRGRGSAYSRGSGGTAAHVKEGLQFRKTAAAPRTLPLPWHGSACRKKAAGASQAPSQTSQYTQHNNRSRRVSAVCTAATRWSSRQTTRQAVQNKPRVLASGTNGSAASTAAARPMGNASSQQQQQSRPPHTRLGEWHKWQRGLGGGGQTSGATFAI